jgi:hypothetical protein
MTSPNYPVPEPPFVIEQAFGRFVHREFPVQIARVKQAKKMCERWGGERG